MAKGRFYYTLVIREDGRWGPQFGDYDKETVEYERTEYLEQVDPERKVKAKDMRIVTTIPGQKFIDAAVRKLNGGIKA